MLYVNKFYKPLKNLAENARLEIIPNSGACGVEFHISMWEFKKIIYHWQNKYEVLISNWMIFLKDELKTEKNNYVINKNRTIKKKYINLLVIKKSTNKSIRFLNHRTNEF